jgi:hypothetical protein
VQGQEWGRSDDIGEVLRERLWDRMSQRGQDNCFVAGVLLLLGEETKGASMKGCSVIQDDIDGLGAKFQNLDRTGFGRRWATDLVRLGTVDIDLMGWD